MKEENKFAAVNRPKDIRINNLSAAKETVSAVKVFYKIRSIRGKKVELMIELNKEIQELELLFTKLYDFMPEHKVLETKKGKKSDIKKLNEKAAITQKNADSVKQIDKLEKSLSFIEEKLKKL